MKQTRYRDVAGLNIVIAEKEHLQKITQPDLSTADCDLLATTLWEVVRLLRTYHGSLVPVLNQPRKSPAQHTVAVTYGSPGRR